MGMIHPRQKHGEDPLNPRIWEPNWYVLSHLKRSIEQMFWRKIKPAAGEQIVDFGCGSRPYEPIFRQAGCRYLGCDLGGAVDLQFQSGQPLPLADGFADGVVSTQVLEHVWDLDWYLGECRRILKPGGWLLLSTHGTWLYHPSPTDFRRWTRDGLSEELRQRGFEVEEMEAVVGPLAWTTFFRLRWLCVGLGKIPYSGLVTLAAICLMNCRMVLEDFVTPSTIRECNPCIYVVLARK